MMFDDYFQTHDGINQVNRVTQVEQVNQVSQVTHEVHLGSTWGSHRSTWGQPGIVCVVLTSIAPTAI